ncbi:hypothetical protein [Acidithiobacillus thiooxidans]|uniref:hypothetical protein n=1 Tax=Acidithiobacillus thiooxidans TaxID=930 RepID=UPI0012D2EAA9|nr:hypothetical protein [Acidithiobacillus thiooxidans]
MASRKRITTLCFSDPHKNSHLIETDVRNLVLGLHGKASIQCLASCHGHGWWRWLKREPYLYFHASAEVVEWIAAVIEVIPLSRQWKVTGAIHPELGLCFALDPLEQSPFLGGHASDKNDLHIMACLLPDLVCFPQQNQNTYNDKKKAAQDLVPAFIERVGMLALRAPVSGTHRIAQRITALFARFQHKSA